MRGRHAVILPCASAAVLLTACAAQEIDVPPDLDQAHVQLFDVAQFTPVPVDILFVVDRSPAMESFETLVRASLRRSLPGLSGMPDQDFHLGVISADLEDGGRLIGSYLSKRRLISGDYATSFPGELEDVLPELADLGHGGSAVPRPFDAVRLALDHNPYNAHFRRADAVLLVILIAAQDDHSAATVDETAAFLQTVAPLGSVAVSIVRPTGATRLDQLAARFSNRSTSVRIEDPDLTDCFVLLRFGRPLGGGDPCLEAPLDGLDCQFSDVLLRRWETPLPACGDQLPCWELRQQPQFCPILDHWMVNVRRAEYPPRGTRVVGQCVTR